MPRYSAAALDRAATAGPPRDEDSWFAVFWPDTAIAAAGSADRHQQFKAAKRQYQKMEAQRAADTSAAAAHGSSTKLVVFGATSAVGAMRFEASTSSALTAAPVDVVLETLNGLLRDQPHLLLEFNARMAPLGHVMDPSIPQRHTDATMLATRSTIAATANKHQHKLAAAEGLPVGTLPTVGVSSAGSLYNNMSSFTLPVANHELAATGSHPVATLPVVATRAAAGAAAIQSQAFLDDLIQQLRCSELSSDSQQLVRRACALGGAHFGHVDDQGTPVLTHLYLNAEGGIRPPHDAHLSGRCAGRRFPTAPTSFRCTTATASATTHQ